MPCGPTVPNPASHMKMIEHGGAAVSSFLESAYWGCMLQCHHSNVSPGANQWSKQSIFTGDVVFPCFSSPQSVAPHQLPKKTGKHILFNVVFWNPLWASKTTFSLKEIVRDWSVSGTCLLHISCPTIARNEYLLHQNSFNLCHCCLLYLLAAPSLLCHVGQ